jgi:hypothetical protein
MASPDYGSLTKELPLATIEKTISAITPGMNYRDLLRFAENSTQSAAPGLIKKRFLVVDASGRIVYDEFLSLVRRQGITDKVVRKVMLFTWVYRDDRIRRFIIERVANSPGKWNTSKLTNKKNADFFEVWYSGGSKARSNFEYFLAETKIYDPIGRKVHLELDDNWLEDAARVAAQHEKDPETRRQLLENPYKFLADKGWQALANATAEELIKREPQATYDEAPDADDSIPIDHKKKFKSIPWLRKKPRSSDKASTEALIDLVARERANQSHYVIEEAIVERIKKLGYEPKSNSNIDVFFTCDNGSLIIEAKSCTENNMHAQIRKGVSQLFEYRYLYSDELSAPIHLALAIETQPSPEKKWLPKYLETIGIILVWLDPASNRLCTQSQIPKMLTGIFDVIGSS